MSADFFKVNGTACLPRSVRKTPPRVMPETKKIPTPISSDADVTLELTNVASRVLAASVPDPIKTEELTANDILEVHNVVASMRSPAKEIASPDSTSEIDVLDILAADVIEAPRVQLPRTLPPPARRANEPTKIIHRDLIDRVQRMLAAKRARSVLMLAAALGTWGYFASFAIAGSYGAYKVATHFLEHESPVAAAVAVASPPSTPATGEVAIAETSSAALAPLLEQNAPALSELASISSARDESTDATPRTSRETVASRSDEIFRRPSKTQVGVLRLPSSVHGLLVDGTPERVTGGSLILACGDHRIRPPHASARVVRVPCGKTVTL